MELLTRDTFRNGVFERDNHKCVICGEPSQDAHHIMERRLFSDGGYYLDNGSSLCGVCHIDAEKTLITTSELREACGIDEILLPEHLYGDYEYDKWGNIILGPNKRIKGELFFDESVTKILFDVRDDFIPYIKYPRTFHVPWTGCSTSDDKILKDMTQFEGKNVVITEKRDGENATVYYDGYFHARSLEGNVHPSQSWLKSNKTNWFFNLPYGWRVCGENLYATHSIKYEDLTSFFEVFSIWDDRNMCLSYKETLEWCEMLEIRHVPTLYTGIYDEEVIKSLELNEEIQEGYVIRNTESFNYGDFRNNVAKYVREDHLRNTVHNWRMCWDSRKINELKEN